MKNGKLNQVWIQSGSAGGREKRGGENDEQYGKEVNKEKETLKNHSYKKKKNLGKNRKSRVMKCGKVGR